MPNDSRHPLLDDFPVVVDTPVAWGDMDYFRHLNNIVFFRYFESARIAYLERIRFEDEVKQGGIGPILHSTSARFRRPVTYPDRVFAGARTLDLLDDRLVMEYRVVSEKLGEVAAEGEGIVVAFDYPRGRKARLPDEVSEAVRRLERGAGRRTVDLCRGRRYIVCTQALSCFEAPFAGAAPLPPHGVHRSTAGSRITLGRGSARTYERS